MSHHSLLTQSRDHHVVGFTQLAQQPRLSMTLECRGIFPLSRHPRLMQFTFSVCADSFMSIKKHEHQPLVIKIPWWWCLDTWRGGGGVDYTFKVKQHIETIPDIVTTRGGREHQGIQFGRLGCEQRQQDSHRWQCSARWVNAPTSSL